MSWLLIHVGLVKQDKGIASEAIFAEKTWTSPSSSGWIHLDNLRFPKSWWYPEKSSSLFPDPL